MKQIPLTRGKVALVDDDDFEELNQYKWYVHNEHGYFYAARGMLVEGKVKTIRMHRQIMNAFDAILIDHKDGNGLNNQRYNIRVCTYAENAYNQKIKKHSSIFKGVGWREVRKRWRASIRFNDKLKELGLFKSEIDAALVYDNKARELFGEFAKTNFIEV